MYKNRERFLEYQRNYHRNRSEDSRERRRAHGRKMYRENTEYEKQRKLRYAATLSEQQKENRRAYFRKQQKQRRLDITYRMEDSLRRRMNKALKGKATSKSAIRFLGCSIPDFRIYLESKFDTGMSWENYGRTGWHIDHIMPCAIFDLSNPEHQKRCFHFSNMQPMWARENLIKGKNVVNQQFSLI